jgi:hypothetical protein
MDKYLYRQEMRKIRWANLRQGLKWGQKEMRVAQDMVMQRLKVDKPRENWKSGDKNKSMSIKDILKGLKGLDD